MERVTKRRWCSDMLLAQSQKQTSKCLANAPTVSDKHCYIKKLFCIPLLLLHEVNAKVYDRDHL